MKRAEIERRTEALLAPIAEAANVRIYDVEFVKEGGDYYLRAFLDKDGGVTIDDCVTVNRALSDALDAADFMEDGYTLEVSSPGLGRRLTKDRHLANSLGQSVDVRLYQAVGGRKDYTGILKAFDREQLTISEKEEERTFSRKEIAVVRLTLEL